MSEEFEEVAQGQYAWLKIESPDDYDRLVGFLDAEFEPKAIARELKNNITSRLRKNGLSGGFYRRLSA